MPNDEGLRHCQCGRFIRVAEMLQVGSAEDSDLPSMQHVKNDLLPQCITQADCEEMEVAARRSYWRHLNHAYREIYRKHRDAEEAETKTRWHTMHPDTRNWWDKLRGRNLPEYRRPADSPFTYPAFQPTSEQRMNMERLSEILQHRHQGESRINRIELAELLREQGRFADAQQLVQAEHEDEGESVISRLIMRLICQQDTAPMRYRM